MKQITLRGVTPDLAQALQKEKRRRGSSLNQAVLCLLRQSLGLSSQRYDNGLSKFAGTWSNKEFSDFKKNTEIFEQVDLEMWQ